MDKSAELSEDEIHGLEMVFNKRFTNLASAPASVEALVTQGYVCKNPRALLPMMPLRFDYELTVHGLMLLREYRPQYS